MLVVRPELLVFAPAYGALLTVNAWFASRRAQRALLNDLSSVLQGCLLVPVCTVAAGGTAASALIPFLVVLLYFVGTVLYVKTMIRERRNATYLHASVAYHALAAFVVAVIAWPLAALFGWFLVRSVLLPRRRMAPKRVGIIEIVNSLALIAVTLLAAP